MGGNDTRLWYSQTRLLHALSIDNMGEEVASLTGSCIKTEKLNDTPRTGHLVYLPTIINSFRIVKKQTPASPRTWKVSLEQCPHPGSVRATYYNIGTVDALTTRSCVVCQFYWKRRGWSCSRSGINRAILILIHSRFTPCACFCVIWNNPKQTTSTIVNTVHAKALELYKSSVFLHENHPCKRKTVSVL